VRVRPRVVVLSLLALVVVGALLLLYSRELFGVDVIKNFFLQQLETSLRRKIEVDRIKLVVLPSLRLELSDVAVYGHDDPTHIVFQAKEIDIVLRLLPLLKKQVVAKRIFLNEPTVTLSAIGRGIGMCSLGSRPRRKTSRPIRCSAVSCKFAKPRFSTGTLPSRTKPVRTASAPHSSNRSRWP
jgi:hypothetical protein